MTIHKSFLFRETLYKMFICMTETKTREEFEVMATKGVKGSRIDLGILHGVSSVGHQVGSINCKMTRGVSLISSPLVLR